MEMEKERLPQKSPWPMLSKRTCTLRQPGSQAAVVGVVKEYFNGLHTHLFFNRRT